MKRIAIPTDTWFPITKTLTQRQKEVLRHVTNGAPYKRIACDLGISEQGVQRHMDNIRKATRIDSTAGLVKFALANRIAKNEFLKTQTKKTT